MNTSNRRYVIVAAACLLLGAEWRCVVGQNSAPGPRAPWTTSRIQGAPLLPAPFQIVPAFAAIRFDYPTSLEEISGEKRMLVTERDGKIFSFAQNSEVQEKQLIIDLAALRSGDSSRGGVSVFHATLHPEFAENRFLFACYVRQTEGVTYVSRFTLTDEQPLKVVTGSERVVIAWPAGGHNGGCLQFGTDGFLYISTGDGSGPNPPDGLTAGQDVSNLFGAILRLDVDRRTGDLQHAVPADNPFVDLEGARPEIWAYGLRNPWKFGVDRQTGEIFAADNGWESWEMVHRIQRGGNCGWPIVEGRAILRSEVTPGPTPIIPPIKDHPHSEANSVIGGPVYRGAKLSGLQGAFVYGDYITGTIWAVAPDQSGGYSYRTLVDTDQRIVAFAESSGGELYVLDYDYTGQIYEVLPSGLKDTSADFPRRLSETGLFDSVSPLEPAAGVVPYDVVVEPWTDGASARRWVAIPQDGEIRLSTGAGENAIYPEGTVFVKHLDLPRDQERESTPLETQIMHYEHGQWQPYSYLWNDAGSDAALVDTAGANHTLSAASPNTEGRRTEQTWHVGAQNECRLCHNAGSRFILGFVPNQLNRPTGESSSRRDQLAALATQNVIADAPAIPRTDPRRLVDPHDTTRHLNARARSYLHANCSMCHHPGGNAIVSFYLRRDLPFDKLNTDKGTGIGTFGMHNAKIIVPGDPYRSLLMYRMSKLGYGRMPYIGSRLVDGAGVSLIDEWIRSLPVNVGTELSAPVLDGTTEQTALSALADDESKPQAQRVGLIRDLVKSTEGALALAAEVHRTRADGGPLQAADVESAAVVGYESRAGDVRGLFETFIPEARRRATLGPNIDPDTILSLQGESARGKLIFFSDGARCRGCHDIDSSERSTGPTLREIIKKYPDDGELLQHVLKPSLKIEEKFAAYSVIKTDGRVVNGLLVDQTEHQVVLKTAEGKPIRIPRNDVDEMHKSTVSLMPERILSDFTPQEAADLFAYLRSLGSASE